MPTLFFKCPNTGKLTSTGMNIAKGTNLSSFKGNMAQCQACGQFHKWNGSEAFFLEEYPQENQAGIADEQRYISPRSKEHGEKDGHYDLLTRIDNAVTSPGGKIKIQIFITGYGEIDGAKIIFYPSPEVIDIKKSTITKDLRPVAPPNVPTWGGNTHPVSAEAWLIAFTGGWNPGQFKKPSMFFDISKEGNFISTEMMQPEPTAPIEVDLHIKKTAKAGTHYLNLGFTYYNGSQWSGSNISIPFTVRNIFQRNELIFSTLGIIATIATIIPLLFTIPFRCNSDESTKDQKNTQVTTDSLLNAQNKKIDSLTHIINYTRSKDTSASSIDSAKLLRKDSIFN